MDSQTISGNDATSNGVQTHVSGAAASGPISLPTAVSRLHADELADEDARERIKLAEVETAVETAELPKRVTEWTSERGLVLRLKKVPRLVVVEAGKQIKMPKVPMVYIAEKERSEPNENDPNYIEELREARFRQGIVSVDVYLTLGTEIKTLPDSMESPEGLEWSETLAELGVIVPERGRARYAAWLKYYALDDEEEVTNLSRVIMQGGGIVFEEAVREATAEFPGTTPRNTDTGT